MSDILTFNGIFFTDMAIPKQTFIIRSMNILFSVFNAANSYSQTALPNLPLGIPATPRLPQVATPQTYLFRPIEINVFPALDKQANALSAFQPIPSSGGQQSAQLQQYEKDLQAVTAKEQQENNIQQELKKEEFYREYLNRLEETKVYRNTFSVFKQLNPDSFSISKAIYLVENAYHNNTMPYELFDKAIKSRAELVRQILKREKIDPRNNTALNYAIQKLYSQSNTYYNAKTKQTITIPPLKYDFKDFMGKDDYKQMFVSKLMMTGKGQCHSMPLLYLAIAEQVGAKAYLSLAPEHSFIQFFDDQSNRLSFETTNGNLVSQNWMLQSGFINAAALKNKTYLDTLSQRRLYAQCLADLLLGYENRFGHDEFAEQIRRQILKTDPANLAAKMLDSGIKTQIALNQIRAVGMPPLKDLPNYPEAYAAYQDMQESYKQIDDLGYQDMPKGAYQAWRKSIDQEKKKQQTREVQERMKKEIEMLKKLKPTFINIPKG